MPEPGFSWPDRADVVAVTSGHGRLLSYVRKFLVIAPLLMVFAMCLAYAAKTRAADDVKASGSDKVVCCGMDDLVLTEGDSVALEPPAVSQRALPLSVENNSGRRVSAELFRPPTAA